MQRAAQFARETSSDGAFVRQPSKFRNWISDDSDAPYSPAAGRYHLYVSLACPWAHRAVIVRHLKGLEDAIGMSVVDPVRDELGWAFRDGPDHGADPLHNWAYLSEAYLQTDPSFDGRITVPVLWDTHTNTVVSNESADVIQMLNDSFNSWAENAALDLAPAHLRAAIEHINGRVYEGLNNGVYRAGFATAQDAYEAAYADVFSTLDELEEILATQRYLTGGTLTLADIRLWTTLIRFDSVYVGHFKCNRRRIVDYPALWGFTRDLFQMPGVADTVNFDHIKRHYYVSHTKINPTGIVPAGPDLDLRAPHERAGVSIP